MMSKMKISKSWIYKVFIIAGLFFSAQFSFADGSTILLPPDVFPDDPPTQTDGLTMEPSASATISETELAVYFEYSVGYATITVYDANEDIVYTITVDTSTVDEVHIPVTGWDEGDYMITVTYGTTTQRGYFSIE